MTPGERTALESFVEASQEMRQQIKDRRHAREVLKRAGYGPDEIPL